MTDRDILRPLAAELAELATLPVQDERRRNWRAVNDLKRGAKPMLIVYQEPWHELNFDGSLDVHCQDEFLRTVETEMRQRLFRWKHFPGDMVIDPFWGVEVLTNLDTQCGLRIQEETLEQDPRGGIVSHHYETLFKSEADVEKIRMLEIHADLAETERRVALLNECFGDILPVKQQKLGTIWYAPWDVISMWYNPMEILMDLMLKPELMHAIMERYTTAMLFQLDQLEAQQLLGATALNHIAGSGGLAYCDELPGDETDGAVSTCRQWGSAAAQIFSDVSPDMHEEFALQYERRWLERFGLSYYGCCEPLHNKLEVLRSVKNLRKISCSPWANPARYAEETAGRYVISIKPNPAAVAAERFNADQVRAEFRRVLDMVGDLPCELVFKDISTCQGDVERLSAWVRIAGEEAQR